jgi:hypothetical protein
MCHLRNLIESRPLLSRMPDQLLLIEEKSGPEHRRACRGDGYAFIYLPQGGSVRVNVESLEASPLRAWWYDPRTGDARDLGVVEGKERMEFTSPWAGACGDWVLVLDSAAKGFPAPGKTHSGA